MDAKKKLLTISVMAGILLLCAFLYLSVNGSPGGTPEDNSRTGFYFNTVTRITVYDRLSPGEIQGILDECDSLCIRYESLFSPTNPSSELYRINHAEGKETTADPELCSLIGDALSYAEKSGGIVDPTIGSLTELWRISDPDTADPPSDAQIREALSHVDYHNVIVSRNSVRLTDPEARLDLGFIAKGYVADRLKDHLVHRGIHSALINLGGNVLTLGNRPDGEPFRVGIRDPRNPQGAPACTLSSSDDSIVSSGDYERFFEKDGIRYHHILSTETGYPAKSGLSQVTIKASSSEEADALSTILFILGKEEGEHFLTDYPTAEAFFVSSE